MKFERQFKFFQCSFLSGVKQLWANSEEFFWIGDKYLLCVCRLSRWQPKQMVFFERCFNNYPPPSQPFPNLSVLLPLRSSSTCWQSAWSWSSSVASWPSLSATRYSSESALLCSAHVGGGNPWLAHRQSLGVLRYRWWWCSPRVPHGLWLMLVSCFLHFLFLLG